MVLLRHGESEWIAEGRFQGQGDSPLTALGRRQAEAAAARLADPRRPPALPIPAEPPAAIVHSPLARTAETARIVAAALASAHPGATEEPRPDPGLLEISQGEWDGRLGSEITARWAEVIAGWREDPLATWAPGGESLPVVDARVRTTLGPVLADLARGRTPGSRSRPQVLGYTPAAGTVPWTLLVGHDGVFKIVLLALLDLPLARYWTFPFALAGLSVVEIQGGRGRLRAHNLVDHLAGLEVETAASHTMERPSGAL